MKKLFPKKIWKRLGLLSFIALFPVLLFLSSQPSNTNVEAWEDWEDGCTSILVGKLASTDGSVMTAHTCDGNYR
ncbi:MAG: peptidase, partial [Candidatus Aminicenantaceae bacterium]